MPDGFSLSTLSKTKVCISPPMMIFQFFEKLSLYFFYNNKFKFHFDLKRILV
jgi:hypothetical protein